GTFRLGEHARQEAFAPAVEQAGGLLHVHQVDSDPDHGHGKFQTRSATGRSHAGAGRYPPRTSPSHPAMARSTAPATMSGIHGRFHSRMAMARVSQTASSRWAAVTSRSHADSSSPAARRSASGHGSW